MSLLKLKNVSKHYQIGDITIKALDDLSFEIKKGEFVAVMGQSGSGKSTFLQVASMLAEPSSGSIFLKGKNVTNFDEKNRAHLRNKEIGFVFQQFNLLAKTSALDNVALPLLYSGDCEALRIKKAKEMLDRVGLSDRTKNAPNQLSGGQQQRVAIARALVNNPSIIFADEPTGNLDSKSGAEIQKLFKKLHQEGKTIIMVTHEKYIAKMAKRLINLKDGKIVSDKKI
ncbi:ABC transporter ATP-binding protein [Patescibacteria group bacterium]|nr:ABC transporter ATP-binding protein [Patescibacteria group bacterium]MBU1885579.1 ABC transporter ATP-binding protein [Patescibacteria group bacterium]